jgi:hypothetical protein
MPVRVEPLACVLEGAASSLEERKFGLNTFIDIVTVRYGRFKK